MFFTRRLYGHPAFREGMREMAPQAVGIGAWGLMTGVAMMKSGLSLVESGLMGVLVFAGSSQLAAIPLLIARAPAWVILATAFCVNLRFVVFSLHLRAYVMHLPLWQRLVHGYFTADVTYVLFTRRFPVPATQPPGHREQEAYLSGLCFMGWGSWTAASVAGIALASLVPTSWGLGFAGILCLVGITCSLAATRLRLVAAAVAGVVAVATYAVPLKLNIVIAIAAAVLACLSIERVRALRRNAA